MLLLGFVMQAGGILLRDYARLPQRLDAGDNAQDAISALRRIEAELGCASLLLTPASTAPVAQVSWEYLNPALGTDPPRSTDRLPFPVPEAPGTFDPLDAAHKATAVVQVDGSSRLVRVVAGQTQVLATEIESFTATRGADGLVTMEVRCRPTRTLIHQAWVGRP